MSKDINTPFITRKCLISSEESIQQVTKQFNEHPRGNDSNNTWRYFISNILRINVAGVYADFKLFQSKGVALGTMLNTGKGKSTDINLHQSMSKGKFTVAEFSIRDER